MTQEDDESKGDGPRKWPEYTTPDGAMENPVIVGDYNALVERAVPIGSNEKETTRTRLLPTSPLSGQAQGRCYRFWGEQRQECWRPKAKIVRNTEEQCREDPPRDMPTEQPPVAETKESGLVGVMQAYLCIRDVCNGSARAS